MAVTALVQHQKIAHKKKLSATGPKTVEHCIGLVTAIDGDAIEVISGEVTGQARRAASCLLEVSVGDTVSCLMEASSHFWILAVLERTPGQDNVLRCNGHTRLQIDQGGFDVEAGDVQIKGAAFSMDTESMQVNTGQARFLSDEVHVVSKTFKLIGNAFHSVLDRVQHFSKHYVRTTEGMHRVQADHIDQQAKQLMRMQAQHTLIDGEKLVKTRGGQIHFG